jgi:uncharacterized protein involved in type VI secretion and phage assembly
MGGEGLRLAEVSSRDDPEGLHRVQLQFGEAETRPWARVAGFAASSGSGAVFFPEIGDEVVVGTLADGEPVVLGSLYSDRNPPPESPGPQNDLKTFASRGGLSLTFDEERGAIRLETPSGQRVILDQAGREIRLEDGGGSEVVLSREGVSIQAMRGLTISAYGPVAIEGRSISLKSTGALDVEALAVQLKAHGALSATSGAELDLETAGVARLRGAMVEIN